MSVKKKTSIPLPHPEISCLEKKNALHYHYIIAIPPAFMAGFLRDPKMKLIADNKCFVCGRENPAGLRIPFKVDIEKKTISCEFTAGHEYQGFKGITHGGIIATLLDEAMVRLAFDLGIYAVTASIEVRYINPLMSGEKVHVSASITKEARKLLEAEAEAMTIDGKAVAKAKGKLIRILGSVMK